MKRPRPVARSPPPRWSELVAEIEGLEIIGAAGDRRALVEATDAAIAEARAILGDAFHVEPVIHRDPLEPL